MAAWWNIEARLDQFDTQDEFDEVLLYIPRLNKENDFTSCHTVREARYWPLVQLLVLLLRQRRGLRPQTSHVPP